MKLTTKDKVLALLRNEGHSMTFQNLSEYRKSLIKEVKAIKEDDINMNVLRKTAKALLKDLERGL